MNRDIWLNSLKYYIPLRDVMSLVITIFIFSQVLKYFLHGTNDQSFFILHYIFILSFVYKFISYDNLFTIFYLRMNRIELCMLRLESAWCCV